MSGGEFNDSSGEARLSGEVRTAPKYRSYAVRDVSPVLHPTTTGGRSVSGELDELTYLMLAGRLLPRELAELEPSIIEVEDGSGVLPIRMRDAAVVAPDAIGASDVGGYRAYYAQSGMKSEGIRA